MQGYTGSSKREPLTASNSVLFVQEKVAKGELGKLQFLRGSHQQNMSLPGWPDYWYGFPPTTEGGRTM